ncbi:hypothetical protein CKF54_02425 [Psittacicella hinzii]|uniref:Uncharacterized protein n=1 Tax=Psittacicella hinzii TaxID=2028575 RepID=A0A3A1Y904_9GAMM|nr:hypothetical protein [Psittacicella hinzii]RIY33678.1 hypothetical protein CKF54_02425 [Psittacicella hinzii]
MSKVPLISGCLFNSLVKSSQNIDAKDIGNKIFLNSIVNNELYQATNLKSSGQKFKPKVFLANRNMLNNFMQKLVEQYPYTLMQINEEELQALSLPSTPWQVFDVSGGQELNANLRKNLNTNLSKNLNAKLGKKSKKASNKKPYEGLKNISQLRYLSKYRNIFYKCQILFKEASIPNLQQQRGNWFNYQQATAVSWIESAPDRKSFFKQDLISQAQEIWQTAKLAQEAWGASQIEYYLPSLDEYVNSASVASIAYGSSNCCNSRGSSCSSNSSSSYNASSSNRPSSIRLWKNISLSLVPNLFTDLEKLDDKDTNMLGIGKTLQVFSQEVLVQVSSKKKKRTSAKTAKTAKTTKKNTTKSTTQTNFFILLGERLNLPCIQQLKKQSRYHLILTTLEFVALHQNFLEVLIAKDSLLYKQQLSLAGRHAEGFLKQVQVFEYFLKLCRELRLCSTVTQVKKHLQEAVMGTRRITPETLQDLKYKVKYFLCFVKTVNSYQELLEDNYLHYGGADLSLSCNSNSNKDTEAQTRRQEREQDQDRRQGQDLRQYLDQRQGQDLLRQGQDLLRQGQDLLRQGQDLLRQDLLRQDLLRQDLLRQDQDQKQEKVFSKSYSCFKQNTSVATPWQLHFTSNPSKTQFSKYLTKQRDMQQHILHYCQQLKHTQNHLLTTSKDLAQQILERTPKVLKKLSQDTPKVVAGDDGLEQLMLDMVLYALGHICGRQQSHSPYLLNAQEREEVIQLTSTLASMSKLGKPQLIDGTLELDLTSCLIDRVIQACPLPLLSWDKKSKQKLLDLTLKFAEEEKVNTGILSTIGELIQTPFPQLIFKLCKWDGCKRVKKEVASSETKERAEANSSNATIDEFALRKKVSQEYKLATYSCNLPDGESEADTQANKSSRIQVKSKDIEVRSKDFKPNNQVKQSSGVKDNSFVYQNFKDEFASWFLPKRLLYIVLVKLCYLTRLLQVSNVTTNSTLLTAVTSTTTSKGIPNTFTWTGTKAFTFSAGSARLGNSAVKSSAGENYEEDESLLQQINWQLGSYELASLTRGVDFDFVNNLAVTKELAWLSSRGINDLFSLLLQAKSYQVDLQALRETSVVVKGQRTYHPFALAYALNQQGLSLKVKEAVGFSNDYLLRFIGETCSYHQKLEEKSLLNSLVLFNQVSSCLLLNKRILLEQYNQKKLTVSQKEPQNTSQKEPQCQKGFLEGLTKDRLQQTNYLATSEQPRKLQRSFPFYLTPCAKKLQEKLVPSFLSLASWYMYNQNLVATAEVFKLAYLTLLKQKQVVEVRIKKSSFGATIRYHPTVKNGRAEVLPKNSLKYFAKYENLEKYLLHSYVLCNYPNLDPSNPKSEHKFCIELVDTLKLRWL